MMAHRSFLPDNYMKIPERINITAEVLDRHVAAGMANKPAIYYENEVITYGELQQRVNKFGNVLKKMGFAKGDRFIIRSENCPEYIVSVLGGMKIGAVPIPTNTLFRSWEIEHIINNSGSKAAFTQQSLISQIEKIKNKCATLEHIVLYDEVEKDMNQVLLNDMLKDVSSDLEGVATNADDLAFMIYTSGTTSAPKGVQHIHQWIIGAGHPNVYHLMRLTENDTTFFPHELSFMYSFGCNFLFPLYAGASCVLWAGRFNVEKCMNYIEKYKVTIFVTVPTVLRMILNEKDIEKTCDCSAVKYGFSGGEPLPQDTYNEFLRRFGIQIFDTIGQTEIHLYLGNCPGMKVKPGSMGKPFVGHTVSVVDNNGNPVSQGEIGHIVIDGEDPGLTIGYRKMPELWANYYKNGWFYTGDLGYIDKDGYYWYVSRSDDLIKSRAYLISPAEVESATMEHPAVMETAVVGVPDKLMGKKVKAFIVLKTGYDASVSLMEEIQNKCKEIIAPFKVPKEVEFVDQLPKTATGKIMRRILRENESK